MHGNEYFGQTEFTLILRDTEKCKSNNPILAATLDRRMTGTDRVGIIRYSKLVISEFQKPCYISKTLHLKQESTLIFGNFDFLGQFSKILRFSKFSKFYIWKVILHFISSLPPWLPAQTVTWNENQHSYALITIAKITAGGSLLRLIATIPGGSGPRGLPQTCFVMVRWGAHRKYLRDFVSKLGLEKPDFGPECSRLLLVKTSPQTPLAL